MNSDFFEEKSMNTMNPLATFVAQTQFEDILAHVCHRAKLTILDTLGVALRGASIEEIRCLANLAPRDGNVSLWIPGFPCTTDLTRAAFINTTAMCAVELDEISTPSAHPALHILPVLLALAQQQGSSGRDLLAAFILGYEVHQRLQKGVALRNEVYPHGNLGYIGAMAAVGKLLSWNAKKILNAMHCVASLPLTPSYHNCIAGHMIAATFASFTATTCMQTVDLVNAGFTASPGTLQDTYGVVLGQTFGTGGLLERLGEDYALEHNNFKFHACCGVIHPAIEAVADALGFSIQSEVYPPFRPAESIAVSEIRTVRLWVSQAALRLAKPAEPHPLAGKFSLPFAIASFLKHQHAAFDAFDADAMSDPEVRRLQASVITAELSKAHSPALAVAEIERVDGSILHGRCSTIYGRAGSRSTDKDVHNKFLSLTMGVVTPKVASELIERVSHLDITTNVVRLFDGLN